MKKTKSLKPRVLVPQKIALASCSGSLSEVQRVLGNRGYYAPPDLDQYLSLMMQEGVHFNCFNKLRLSSACFVYFTTEGETPGKQVRLTTIPFITSNATEVQSENTSKREFYLGEDDVREVLRDSVEVEGNPQFIPAEGFERDKISTYLFGRRRAKEIGSFLKEHHPEGLVLRTLNVFKFECQRPFVRPARFAGPGYQSEILINGQQGLYDEQIYGVLMPTH